MGQLFEIDHGKVLAGLGEEMRALIAPLGLILREPHLPLVNSQRSEKAAYDLFHQQLEIFRSCQRLNEKVLGNVGVSWNALSQLGLRAPEEWYESYLPSDSIEIFDFNQNVMFRNLEFFRYTYYSFEELLLLPYRNLFQRDKKVSEQYWGEIVDKGFMAKDFRVWNFSMGIFRIQELETPEKAKFAIKPKSIAPLQDKSGAIVAAAVCTDSRLIP